MAAKKKNVMPRTVTKGVLLYVAQEGTMEFESIGGTPLQECGMLIDALLNRFQGAVQYMNDMCAIAYERGRLDAYEDAGHELQNVLDIEDANAASDLAIPVMD